MDLRETIFLPPYKKMNDLKQYRAEFVQLVAAALVFVVGAAWNSAFQDLVRRYEWLQGLGPFVYAALLTVVIGVIVYVLKSNVS